MIVTDTLVKENNWIAAFKANQVLPCIAVKNLGKRIVEVAKTRGLELKMTEKISCYVQLSRGLCHGYAMKAVTVFQETGDVDLKELHNDPKFVDDAVYWMLCSCKKMHVAPECKQSVLVQENGTFVLMAVFLNTIKGLVVVNFNALSKNKLSHTVVVHLNPEKNLYEYHDSAKGFGLYRFATVKALSDAIKQRYSTPGWSEYLWEIQIF